MSTVTFYVELVDSEDAEYEGSFTVKERPSFQDLGAISAGVSRLAMGQPLVEVGTASILRAIAELQVLIVTSPKWWSKVVEDERVDIVLGVYEAYVGARPMNPFRPAQKKKSSTVSSSEIADSRGQRDSGRSSEDSEG